MKFSKELFKANIFYDYENDQENILAQNLIAMIVLVIAAYSAYFKTWPIIDGFLKQLNDEYKEPENEQYRSFPKDIQPYIKLLLTTSFFSLCYVYKQLIIRFGKIAISKTVGLLRLSNEEYE